MATGYIPNTTGWSKQSTSPYYYTGWLRLHYSTSYNADNNTSTVTITPQFKSSTNAGNDYRFWADANTTDAGIWGGQTGSETKRYTLPTGGYSASGYLKCGQAHDGFVNITKSDGSAFSIQFTIQHDSSGAASFKAGIKCTVTTMLTPNQNTISNAGQKLSDAVSVTGSTYTLTTAVSPNGYGTVTVTGSTTLAPTAQASLKATPASATTKYTYSFKDWSNTSGTLSSTTTNPTTFTMGTANATVTANFQVTPKSYTATFTKGDYISSVSGGGTKDYGSNVTATATLGSATGYTYSFDGWYSGTTKISSSNPYTFTMPDSNVSYTAKGKRTANTYTVSFNKKGGSGTDVTQTLTYDKSEALKLNTYTKTGYTFKGWDTNSAGTTVVYTDGASVKNLASSGTYTLYAVWQINTWTISYNANGGTGAPSSQTKTYNIDLTLSSTKPTRSSTNPTAFTITYNANGGTVSKSSDSAKRTTTYSFNKWNTKSDGSGTNYNSGATYKANAAATLYAQWNSSTTTAAVTLPTATRTGYTFKGWNTNSSATTGTTGSYTATGNVTLYAIWELNSYTLTISQGSGSTIVVKKGSTQLSNGATIYYNDVLTITFSANTGYNLSTHTVNNTAFTSGNTYTVTGATTVASTATKKTYTLSITTSSEGVSTTVNRTSSPIGGGATGNLTNGATLYYNDVLNISYTIGGAYQLLTATVNNTDISSQSLPYTLTATGNVTISITVKIGAIVYIGNQAYQIYIGNTSTNKYEQYQAYIGNSSAGRYDQY